MNWNNVLYSAVEVGVAGLLLLGGVLLLTKLRAVSLAGKTPGVAELLQALEAWAIKAIYAGENIALVELSTADRAITGADKKAIADKLYALLPDVITVGGKPIPIGYVKAFVTLEVWEAFVQREFDALDALIRSNEDWLKKQVVGVTASTSGTSSSASTVTITADAAASARAAITAPPPQVVDSVKG